MTVEELAGTWKGFYTYGPDYPESFQDQKDEFTLKLVVTDEVITGSAEDFITAGQGAAAFVEGTYVDEVLSFVKRYKYRAMIDELGNTLSMDSGEGYEVFYTGAVSRDELSGQCFAWGTWDISGSLLDDNGTAAYYSDSGDWEMEKIG